MLSINVSELIWTIVNFFLLYLLLKHFLYTPVVRFLDARQARLDEAEKKEADARAVTEELEKKIEDDKALRREEAAALLSASQREDAERSRGALAEAKAEAARAMESGSERLHSEQEKERAALLCETDELAEALAGQLLDAGK